MMKLTKQLIDASKYDTARGTKDIRWDDALPGFGVRLYPSGVKSFVLFYRSKGRQRFMSLGKYGVLTLEEARGKARRALADALDGGDALVERKKARNTAVLSDLARDFLEKYSKRFKKTWKKDESRIRRLIGPRLGSLAVDAISRADVTSFHHKVTVESGPYEANRTLELLSTMFSKAEQWGYVVASNPAKGIRENREEKRDRWVTMQELPRLAEAIGGEQNLYIRQALWLYLLTGARKSELLNAKWEDIDWNRRELRIQQTKAGRVHYVPLSQPALEMLRDLPRHSENPHIFPGHKRGAPLVNIDKSWRRIRAAAGVEDVRLHDLRRTVGSWLAQAGNSLHLVGRVLNHSNPSTTAVYARFAQDNVRLALEDHGRHLMDVAQGAKAEVIPLKRKA